MLKRLFMLICFMVMFDRFIVRTIRERPRYRRGLVHVVRLMGRTAKQKSSKQKLALSRRKPSHSSNKKRSFLKS